VYSRMPYNQSNTPLMSHQVHNRLFKISQQSALGDLPYLDGAVFRAAGNDVVIMWAPLNVEDSSAVSHDQRTVPIHTSSLSMPNINSVVNITPSNIDSLWYIKHVKKKVGQPQREWADDTEDWQRASLQELSYHTLHETESNKIIKNASN